MIIYTISAHNGFESNATWSTIYDPRYIDISTRVDAAYNITLNTQTGSAGSLTFTVPPGHPFYSSFRVLGTSITVHANGTLIWGGRVLRIKRDFLNNKTIECEGALAFLNDILTRPESFLRTYVNPDYWAGKTVQVQDSKYGHEVMQIIIDNYNHWCSNYRNVSWSYDSGLFSMDVAMYQNISGYDTTLSAINKLIECDDDTVIDWHATGGGLNIRLRSASSVFPGGGGYIRLDTNLTDFQSSVDGSDFFTQIIPFDKNKKGVETESTGNVPPDAYQGSNVGHYGVIEKVYNYADEDVDGSLFMAAYEIMNQEDLRTITPPDELTISAVDMALVGSSGLILPGYSYSIVDGYHSITATYNCVGINVRLDEPGSASYSFLRPQAGYKLKMAGLTSKAINIEQQNQAITTKTEIFKDEAPERLVKIDDNHIVAVMNGRAEHYRITKFATDEVTVSGETEEQDHYDLEIYESSVPSDLPDRPTS